MKKLFLKSMLCMLIFNVQAQDTKTEQWDIGGTSRLSFSQVNLTKWSAGG